MYIASRRCDIAVSQRIIDQSIMYVDETERKESQTDPDQGVQGHAPDHELFTFKDFLAGL